MNIDSYYDTISLMDIYNHNFGHDAFIFHFWDYLVWYYGCEPTIQNVEYY